MHKSLRTLLIAAVTIALAGTATAQNVLRIAQTSGPPTLDAHFNPSRITGDIAMNVFEGLVGYGEDLSIRPQLAESWTISDDGLLYTFTLHEGVEFHNGEVLTADDVLASLERVLAISPEQARFGSISEINVVDDHTVELVLSEPNSVLLQALAATYAVVMPRSAIEGVPGGEAEIVGTGPFQLAEWLPDQHVRLVPFENYVSRNGEANGNVGQKDVLVDELRFLPVPEESARANGLQTGEYDVADFLPYSAGRRLAQEPGLEIVEVEQHMMVFAYFNFRDEHISANTSFRQAVQAVLNHDEIMAVASEGYGSLNPSYYFGFWTSDGGTHLFDQRDPELARQLLADAGYNGETVTIITNTGYDVMYRSALMIERQLQSIGVNTAVEVYDWPGALAARAEGNWDIFLSGHLLQEDPSVIEFHLQPSSSPFAFGSEQVSEYFQQGRLETDYDVRHDIYTDMQAYLYENAVWIKLFDQNIFQGINARVEGYTPWPYMRGFNVSVGE